MQIIALWCHPRSMSTAIERVMRERGDLDVLHEPFMYDYYLTQPNRRFAHFEPDPGHPRTYAEIREMILDRATAGPVFFKDMGYYVVRALPQDAAFLRALTHTFLVRDPAASIISYQRRDPGFTREEAGLEALWRVFEAVREAGLATYVLEAEAVRADPVGEMARYCAAVGLAPRAHALEWGREAPAGWESVAAWHRETLEAGAILPPEEGRDAAAELAALGAPWTEWHDHHRRFYDLFRTELAHQKSSHQK